MAGRAVPGGHAGSAAARLAAVRGWVFDMDGTLVLGDRVNHGLAPLPGAAGLLARLRERGVPYVVFTNGTNRAPAHFARVLRDAGLDVPDDQMMTPASSAAVMLARHGHKRVMLLGGEGLAAPLRGAGIEVVPPAADSGDGRPALGEADVDAVLVGWFPEFTMPALEAATHAVWGGARLYSASQTPFFAAAGGRALGTSRAICAMITSLTGCRATVTGKPSLDALRAAATRLGGLPLSALAVVGDDPLLEVPMAHRGKALAIAVQTGLAGPGAYDQLPGPKRPHLHLRGVDELLSLLDGLPGHTLSLLPAGANNMSENHAVAFTEFGDPSVLHVITLPVPEPGPGQVRVHVTAATVNPTDLGFRAGGRALPSGVEPPYIPGMDLAGVIDAAGPGAGGWAAGDRVMAAVSPWARSGGGCQEYRLVDIDQLARVPDGMPLELAATLPMNGMTVRAALDILSLPAGAVLAITGSPGAVGGYAIQLGRHSGLTVVADAAAADEELIRSLGADHVVPRGDGFAAAVRELFPDGVDALIDAGLAGPPVLAAVRDGGQLLAVRPFRGETERDIKISLVMVGEHLHEGTRVAELAGLATQGVLTLRLAEAMPAERAAEAHARLEAGGVRGRLVLTF